MKAIIVLVLTLAAVPAFAQGRGPGPHRGPGSHPGPGKCAPFGFKMDVDDFGGIEEGRVKRAYLGVEPLPMSPELRRFFGAPDDAGVLVSRVFEDSPAAKAKVMVGDVITGIDGEKVDAIHDLIGRIVSHKAGDVVSLSVFRDKKHRRIEVTLVERDRAMMHLGPWMRFGKMPAFRGVCRHEDDPEARAQCREQMRGLCRDADTPEKREACRNKMQERLKERLEHRKERLHELEERLRKLDERLKRAEQDL